MPARAFKQDKRKSDESYICTIQNNILVDRDTPKKKLLAKISNSIMLYGAPIWGKAVPTNVAKIRSSYRITALRVACSYRTVSYDAICVISSMIPIELLAQEQPNLYVASHPKKNVERENTK